MSQALKIQWLWNTVFSESGCNISHPTYLIFYIYSEWDRLRPLPLNLGGLVIHFNQKNKADTILLGFWGNQLLPCARELAFGVLSCCVRSPTIQRHHALMRAKTIQKDHMQCLVTASAKVPVTGQHQLLDVCTKKPRGLQLLGLPSWGTSHYGAEISYSYCTLPKFQTKRIYEHN